MLSKESTAFNILQEAQEKVKAKVAEKTKEQEAKIQKLENEVQLLNKTQLKVGLMKWRNLWLYFNNCHFYSEALKLCSADAWP